MAVQFRSADTVDFIVIGAGAAGGVVAKQLSTAGFTVVVLEQGPYLRERDFRHDEIGVINRAAITNDPALLPNTFRRTDSEPARKQRAVEYARLVGGGSVHFTANYWRFHESDFHERSLYGPIAGTGFADWPITYYDLEPYYTQAEEEIGVSGLAGSNPFDPPRSKPYPLPPMPVKSSGVLFDKGCAKLGLHSYPAPVAILSQPYRGRGACTHCGFCEYFGCEMRAKSSTLASVIPVAEKTGRCEIRPLSYVRRIQTGDDGRVTGAVYFDANRREIFQRARAVVVCANGAESPRLLLLSKSNRFPRGLANSSGAVGRYLMFDVGAEAFGLFPEPLNEYKSIQATRVCQDYYDADPKRGFYGGGGMDARFDFYPVLFGLAGLPPDAPKWGPEYKKMLARNFTRTMTILNHGTCLAMPKNTITLDPEVRDAWGLPAMRVTFQNHPDDLKSLEWMLEKQRAILDAAGAQKIWSAPVANVDYSVHLMGTCRMGNDPKTSVVNRWNQSHDIRNLFIVDGSSLVTCARQQPTATIQALAYRAAENMAKLAKAGEL